MQGTTYRMNVEENKFRNEEIDIIQPRNVTCVQIRSLDRATYVNLFTSDRYSSGDFVPTANCVKTVTNFPNTMSMRGSNVPETIAAAKAMMLSVQLSRSAYLKTRCARLMVGLSLIHHDRLTK